MKAKIKTRIRTHLHKQEYYVDTLTYYRHPYGCDVETKSFSSLSKAEEFVENINHL